MSRSIFYRKIASRDMGISLETRNEDIKTLHFKDGWTLQEIGNKYKLTRERVRQIVGGSNNARSKASKKIYLPDNPTLSVYELIDIAKKQFPKVVMTVLRKRIASQHHMSFGKNQEIGEIGEMRVFEKLNECGFHVELMPYGHPFDLLINNEIKIDVKTSKTVVSTSKMSKASYYRFSIKTNEKKSCDYFIFYAIENDRFWVVPLSETPDTGSIYINSGNGAWRHKNGKNWDQYINRFELLKESIT